MPCPYLNPGQYVRGRPLVQGMRVALAAEVRRTHEELVERILHAGLAYRDAVDDETSLVICNAAAPAQGKGYLAERLGVPMVSDALFMDGVGAVMSGTSMDTLADATPLDEQLALSDAQPRAARLTAETTARSEAVVIDGAIPRPTPCDH